MLARNLRAAVAACLLASCSQASAPAMNAADGGVPASGEFVAYTANFDGYRAWSHITVVDDGGSGATVHTPTPLVEYINRPPPAPPTAFPPGTILVKEADTGDPSTRQAFAMAKRGGDYNAAGAAGWEWFELQNIDSSGGVEIVWRGTAPPAGQVYAGNVNGDCNLCHAKAPHDGVFAQ